MPGPARRKVGWRETARFWLAEHNASLGLPLTILAFAALFGLAGLILAPRYPARDITGQITGLGFAELEGQGSVSTASIKVADGFARVELPARHGCRIGDRIQLRQLGVRWGYMYRVKNTRWPCQR
ncbi:hypothetical protein [Brevundimonas sp. FT23028]|uniref:hypothetical protein n=1 Tax=Brevundimonas sp. FT23028 TaxID=3393748 RepID=UPI003B589CC9